VIVDGIQLLRAGSPVVAKPAAAVPAAPPGEGG